MTIGEQITQLRRERKMSQEELAEELQISRQSVSKWENGLSNPDTENLIRLAEIFRVDVNVLIGSQLEPEEKPAQPTLPPDQRKTVRILSLFLALSVCLCGIFAGLWLGEKSRTDSLTMKGNLTTRWNSIAMYEGLEGKEVDLTDVEKAELADKIWTFSYSKEQVENAPDEKVPAGGLHIQIVMSNENTSFTWLVTSKTTVYSVKLKGGSTFSCVFESDQNMINWLETYIV